MELPPNSPHLNTIIEHCWNRVRERLPQYFTNIPGTKQGSETVRKHLAEAPNQVWAQDIEGEFPEQLWESLSNRVATILDARGWYPKS